MNFFEMIGGALGGRQAAQQQAEEAGLPPLTVEQLIQQTRQQSPILRQAEEEFSQYQLPPVAPGMFQAPGALPGPAGTRLPVPGQPGPTPRTGTVEGSLPVPYRAPAQTGGNVYPGQTVGPAQGGAPGTGVVPLRPGAAGAPGQSGGPAGPVGTGKSVSPYPDTRLGRIQENFANMTGLQKAALGGTGAATAWNLPEMWSRIFGGEEAEAGTPFPGIPLPGGGTGQGATAGLPRVNELPSAWRSEMQEMVPSVDYDSLPRPDFDRARQMLLDLGPEAPEERTWLDKLPSQMKSMLGFGILLGPIGLLLGAGLGMAENRAIDKARQERFKQESREHLEQLIENDLNWSMMERQMELGDRQGRREEAREDLTMERMFQQWGMDDAGWMQDMNLKRAQEAALLRSGAQGPLTLDRLWENALMVAPDIAMQGYLQQMEQVSPAAWAQMTNDQKNEMQRMFQANVMRGLYR